MNKYLLGVLTGVAATVVAVKYKDEIRQYKDEIKELCDELLCKCILEDEEEYNLSSTEK